MFSPLFSIIIPVFNGEKVIGRAIESILRQSFQDYEILVVDGLSTDRTVSIVREYSDERIKIVSEKDQGIYDAMNKGIDMAKGEWIYFLGSDDELFDKYVLEKVFRYTTQLKSDVLYGQVFLRESGQLYLGKFDAQKLIFRNISHQAIFVKKSLFKRLGKFDLKYKICADHIFNIKWFFDATIQHAYIDIVVAKFSLGGVSNTLNDWDKIRDLPGLVKKCGGKFIYFRFYVVRPRLLWLTKKINYAKDRVYTMFK